MSFIIEPATAIVEPIDAPVDLLTNTVAPYYSGSAYTWTITNFDSFTTYTVTTTNGTVSQASGTVTYTPASGGTGGFIINDRIISLTITGFPVITASTPSIFVNAQITGILSVAQLTTTKAIILYNDVTSNGVYAIVASISGTVVTYGAAVLVRLVSSPPQASICALSSTLCLVGYETTAVGQFGAKTLSISGTTITANAEVNNGISGAIGVVLCTLTATTALAMFDTIRLCVVSVSGTVPSFGTPASTGLSANYKSLSTLSSTKAILLYDGTSGFPTTQVISVAGTVVTIGSALVIQSIATDEVTSVIALSATTAIAEITGTSSVVKIVPLTISGSTVTAGSISSLTATQIYPAPQAAAFIDSNSGVALYQNAAGAGVGVAALYGTPSLVPGVVTTLVPGTSIRRMTGVYLDTNKIFCVFNTGTASASGCVISVS